MSNQLFTSQRGRRGKAYVNIQFHQLYQIVRDRLEYAKFDGDPDAFCQRVCVEVEKANGTFPNIDGVKEDGTTVNLSPEGDLTPEAKLLADCKTIVKGLNAVLKQAHKLGLQIDINHYDTTSSLVAGYADIRVKRTTVELDVLIQDDRNT